MGWALPTGLDYSSIANGFILPVADGAEYYNFFNSADNIARNLVSGKQPGTKNGAPVFNGQSVTLVSLQDYINTGVKQTDEMTIITLGEPTAPSGNFVHWSSYGSPVTNGGTGLTSQDYVRQSVTSNNPTISLTYSNDGFATRKQLSYGVSSGADSVKLRTLAARFSQSAKTSTLQDLTNNKISSAAVPSAGVLAKSGNILLGSHYTSVEASAGKLYFVAIYSRQLNDDELNKVYASIKSYYQNKGISA